MAAAPERDGRWPLVTNRSGLSDEELCTWAVRRYKTHGRIERDHHLLKGPLAVRPLFVQNDARIRSLVAVCVWALTAWKLMERQAPGALASMPKSGRPKASLVERIEAFFQAIALVRFRVGNNVRQSVSALPSRTQSLLHSLGWHREVRGILDDATHARPPGQSGDRSPSGPARTPRGRRPPFGSGGDTGSRSNHALAR